MLKILLFPFSVLYDIVTRVRNHLYDRGLKPSVRFDLPVIGVGNLSVGGTGKTPMIEYLVRLLMPDYNVATLSRGYGRKTQGFLVANEKESAETIGDEPFQYYKKFSPRVYVAVGEERALAIPLMLQDSDELDVILMDDAFQHRKVRPSLQILLTDYARPFYQDLLLPAGRLRESSGGASRADLIVVSKCPSDLSDDRFMEMEKGIRAIAEKPVFFSKIIYGNPVPFQRTNAPCGEKILLITGIADARPLVDHIKRSYSLAAHVDYSDHHQYTAKDMQAILEKAKTDGLSVVTTEKDMVKMDVQEFSALLEQIPFFYIPITVQFLKHEAEFNEIILNHVRMMDKKNDETDR
jgi:tetraacyldisaccharide 4'-kinase